MATITEMSLRGYFAPPRSYNCHPPVPVTDESANKCKSVKYRGQDVAAFIIRGNIMLCLPQACELLLSHLDGGLRTVYKKLKELHLIPFLCNHKQVQALRDLGVIKPTGLNCKYKLLSCEEFDILYAHCAPRTREIDNVQMSLENMSISRVAQPFDKDGNKVNVVMEIVSVNYLVDGNKLKDSHTVGWLKERVRLIIKDEIIIESCIHEDSGISYSDDYNLKNFASEVDTLVVKMHTNSAQGLIPKFDYADADKSLDNVSTSAGAEPLNKGSQKMDNKYIVALRVQQKVYTMDLNQLTSEIHTIGWLKNIIRSTVLKDVSMSLIHEGTEYSGDHQLNKLVLNMDEKIFLNVMLNTDSLL